METSYESCTPAKTIERVAEPSTYKTETIHNPSSSADTCHESPKPLISSSGTTINPF